MATKLQATRKSLEPPFKLPKENPLPGEYDLELDGRRYANEDLINLRDWLNDARGTGAYDRVTALIEEVRSLQSDFDRSPLGWKNAEPSDSELETDRLFGERFQQIRTKLTRYTFSLRAGDAHSGHRRRIDIALRPDALPDDFTPPTKLSPISANESKITNPGTYRMSEGAAILCFARLHTSGELHRLRLCDRCKREWIAATKTNYKFCSDKCREETYAATPEYKKRKREQMRRQRRNERLRAAKGISSR
jgi:hypothetical protein